MPEKSISKFLQYDFNNSAHKLPVKIHPTFFFLDIFIKSEQNTFLLYPSYPNKNNQTEVAE